MKNETVRLEALSDDELARVCAQEPRDEQAWYVFYSRFYRFVYGRIRRKLWLSTAQIEEVVHDVFTRIVQVLPSYDPSKAPLRVFLSEIVTNLVIDYWRHGATEWALTIGLVNEILAFQAADPGAVHQVAERIVNEIPDKRRIPLVMALIRGEDVKAICAKYGKTKYEVYASREWLREWLLNEINPPVAKSLNAIAIKKSP